MSTIRLRRGVESDRDTVVPRSGEPLFTTDTKRLYIGDGVTPGGIDIGGGEGGNVSSVNGKTGIVVLDKEDIGLDEVDNTSDADKPVSTAAQTALNGKQPLNSNLTTIAGLSASNDDFLVRVAGAWAARTPSQSRSHLGLGSIALLSAITEANITLADNTTNDFSTTKHGFVPKGTNTGKFLKDDGSWASIPGGGDMLTSTYDPNGVAADAFSMDNMVEGSDTKIMTQAERDAIANQSSINSGFTSDIETVSDDLAAHVADDGNPHAVTKAQVGLGDADNTSDAAKLAAFLPLIYPIGTVLTFGVSTNPATLLGFGTWTAIAGRVIVGIDAGQAEFDTLNETGGAKTHTLTTSEIPSHAHGRGTRHWNPTTGSASSGNSGRMSATFVGGTGVSADSDSGNTASEGGGGAHNNLQPYIVKYVWQRTA